MPSLEVKALILSMQAYWKNENFFSHNAVEDLCLPCYTYLSVDTIKETLYSVETLFRHQCIFLIEFCIRTAGVESPVTRSSKIRNML